jgi:hypothetical protein
VSGWFGQEHVVGLDDLHPVREKGAGNALGISRFVWLWKSAGSVRVRNAGALPRLELENQIKAFTPNRAVDQARVELPVVIQLRRCGGRHGFGELFVTHGADDTARDCSFASKEQRGYGM